MLEGETCACLLAGGVKASGVCPVVTLAGNGPAVFVPGGKGAAVDLSHLHSYNSSLLIKAINPL